MELCHRLRVYNQKWWMKMGDEAESAQKSSTHQPCQIRDQSLYNNVHKIILINFHIIPAGTGTAPVGVLLSPS